MFQPRGKDPMVHLVKKPVIGIIGMAVVFCTAVVQLFPGQWVWALVSGVALASIHVVNGISASRQAAMLGATKGLIAKVRQEGKRQQRWAELSEVRVERRQMRLVGEIQAEISVVRAHLTRVQLETEERGNGYEKLLKELREMESGQARDLALRMGKGFVGTATELANLASRVEATQDSLRDICGADFRVARRHESATAVDALKNCNEISRAHDNAESRGPR